MKRTLVLLAVLAVICMGSMFATQDTTKAAAAPKEENKTVMSAPKAHSKHVAQRSKHHHKSKKVEEKKDSGTSK